MARNRYKRTMDHYPDINGALARVLRYARKQAQMTQAELAGFVGLSEQYIAKAERGAAGVSLNALFALGKVLNVSVAELVSRIEDEVRRGAVPPSPKRGKPAKPGKKRRAERWDRSTRHFISSEILACHPTRG